MRVSIFSVRPPASRSRCSGAPGSTPRPRDRRRACTHHPSGRLRMTKTSASSNRFARRLRSFLFVAFGAPRQDLWIRTHLDRLGVPVAMGVGCVLDLLAGAVQRAPLWVQRGGLEWTYRLAHEPRRLWRRYVREDMPMLGRLLFSSLHNEGDLERLPRGAEGASSHGLPLGF